MVFKKLADHLLSGATTAANTLGLQLQGPGEQAQKLNQLEAMGFPRERARHALNATDWNVDRAAELLLLGGADCDDQEMSPPSTQNNNDVAVTNNNRTNNDTTEGTRREGTHVAAHNDEQMKRAIEESLAANQREESRMVRQAEVASIKKKKNNAAGMKKKKTPQQQKDDMDIDVEVVDLTGDDDSDDGNKKLKAATTNSTAVQKKKNAPTKRQPKSVAAMNAGKAAASRFNNNLTPNTLDQTHPNVKVPEKLSNKTKEEQVMRCANRVKPHVMAVDTLLRVLTCVRNSPGNETFRVIDRTNGNYIKYVRDVTGAEDLLLAMNYRSMLPGRNELRLERHLVDSALLYLGISALEQMKLSTEYIENKKKNAFHAEMRRVAKQGGGDSNLQQTGMSDAETTIRLAYLSKCPKEPPLGRGAWVYVHLGDESESIGKISRRFDSDDTLEDVLHWLGGCYGNEILDKMGRAREWCLCDLNRYPVMPIDIEKHSKKTLQYLGLFPSGKLGVRLSEDAWRDRVEGAAGDGFDVHGSARGLAAASRSMLH